MLCSAVKHAGSCRALEKCRKHETQSSVFTYFLSPLPLPKLLYLLFDREFNNFPTHSAEFSNQTLFSEGVKVASAMLCFLIKHAKISQSQSLLELFK